MRFIVCVAALTQATLKRHLGLIIGQLIIIGKCANKKEERKTYRSSFLLCHCC